jgi:pimeloyl-ACP methyl ester carboxylesterase
VSVTGGRGRRGAQLAALVAAAAMMAGLAAGLRPPAAAADQAPQSGLPRFEPAACPYASGRVPAGERLDCGYLLVPEDRSQPAARSLRLAVAILRSPNPAPAPDPVVFLSGGPGYGALDSLEYWLSEASGLRANRDLILLDQRGTGYSQPSLECWEFEALEQAVRADSLGVGEWLSLEVDTAQACRARLLAEGVNLAAYHSVASAADLKDLRVALGLLEWNVYAQGYGTRLALTLMRDFPAGIRSAVLDGALPPQAAWFEEAAANADRAFNQLFSGCALDSACAAAFPDLQRRFFDSAERLDAGPLIVSVPDPLTGQAAQELVNGQDLIEGGLAALRDTRLIPYLPLAIAQIHTGNYAVVEGLAAALAGDTAEAHSGYRYSVQCHDEAPFDDPARIAASLEAYPRYADVVRRDGTLAVCQVWGAGQAGPVETQPVRSDTPALVLAGQYDPGYPPAWSQLAASTLSNSLYYELPGVGHGASFLGCGQALAEAFIEHPGVPPNVPCASARSGPPFVTAVTLNPGVQRLASRLVMGVEWRRALPFAACGLLLLSALLYWPIDVLRGLRGRPERGPWLARWLAALVAALDLSFAGLLLLLIRSASAEQPYLLIFGLPAQAAPLFAAPWAAAALSLGLAALAGLAWKDGYWSAAGRIHFTLVTAAALGFTWLLLAWELISWR